MTREALAAGGVSPWLGDRQVQAGRWTRLAPSVSLAGDGPPTDGQLVVAARAHAGDDVVVTGGVVCRELGLRDVPEERVVQVLVPNGRRVVSSRYVVVAQSCELPETWVRGAARYADPARAVVDAARRAGHLRAVRALVLAAVRDGHVGVDCLAEVVAQGGSRGSAVLRRALRDAALGAWSAPEAEAGDLVSAAVRAGRLPAVRLHPRLAVGGRVVGRPDGYVLGTGVGWQVDSRRHHEGERDLDATLAVHDAFAAAGITLLHVTPRRLRADGPAWVDALVSAARASREPPGLGCLAEAPAAA